MSKSTSNKALPEVPSQIYASFFQALAEKNMPRELIDRLRITLLKERAVSVAALTNALFLDERS
jgi:hypothetical protein